MVQKFQSFAATTELEALNSLLGSIGEAPVAQSELDTPTRADVTIAINIMGEIMREALSIGWKFNVSFGFEIAPSYDSGYTHTFRDGTTKDYNIFTPPSDLIAFKLSNISGQQGSRFKELVISPRESANDLTAIGTLVIDATPEKFKTTTTSTVRIAGGLHDKSAATAIAFSAADTINTAAAAGYFWGVWLVQVNAAGTVSTKPGGGLSDQVYATKVAAVNAIPEPDAAQVGLGHILIQANTGAAWTAQTDDMTAGSDLSLISFVDFAASESVFLNVAEQTDGLEESVYEFLYIDYIKYVGWTTCPEVFRQYAYLRAARRFSERTVGDPNLSGFSQREERLAFRNLKREQGEKDRLNHSNNLGPFRALGRFRV